MEARALIEEAVRRFGPRAEQRAKLEASRRALMATRFDKQRAFIEDPAPRKAAFCSRRAGKTDNVPADLVEGAIKRPGVLDVYCAITRVRAKELMWEPLKAALHTYGIEGKPNESELDVRLAVGDGTHLRLHGADKIDQAQKKRGDKIGRVRIDEAQLFPFHVLKALVDDVYGPSLEDVGGDLGLLGTPGEVCAGYWYGITRPERAKRTPGWSVHRWNVLDNPHVPLIHARIRSGEIAKQCGGKDTPTYRREWLGEWVSDTGLLVYHFNEDRNAHDLRPEQLRGDGWLHTLGWDLGADDAMALVVWAFNVRRGREIYEAYSWSKSGASTDEVMDHVKALGKQYDFIGQSADTGGLGKLVVQEMARRRSETFEPAQKTDKHGHIKLFNEDLDAGRVKLARNSPLASEMAVLPKVAGWLPEAHDGKPAPEDPRFPNHCCDAGLYAWRYAYPFLHEPEEQGPAKGSPEAYAKEEAEYEERLADQDEENERRPWWER